MYLRRTLVMWGLAASFSVSAVNWNFLEFGAVNYFTDEDLEIFQQAIHDSLESVRDGEVKQWDNARSGAFGTLKPLSSYQAHGAPCRQMEIVNNVKQVSGTSRFDFCRQADGEWKIAPRSAKPAEAKGRAKTP